MRRSRLSLAVLVGMLATMLVAAPASAITNGQPDANEHPYVGQLFFHDPTYPDSRFTDPGAWFNCSGTLISPTVVLTAGHCTWNTGLNGEPVGGDGSGGNDVWVSFLATPDYTGIGAAPFIPDDNEGRYQHYRDTLNANPTWHRGTAYPHPEYIDAAFYLYDVGVVILDEPVQMATYGVLPGLGYLDQFIGKRKARTLFEAVGYGLEAAGPKPWMDQGGDTRMKSQQVIVNAKGVYGLGPSISIVFSNNNGAAHRGGTCYGDSGGPYFRDNTNQIAAVVSFGVTPNCTGNSGAYRIDQPDDVAWLQSVLAGNPRP